MIDLSSVQAVLDDVVTRMEALQGIDLIDTRESDSQSKTVGKMSERAKKAQVSRDLQWCADSLNLAASLVRNEYWVFKGNADLLFANE